MEMKDLYQLFLGSKGASTDSRKVEKGQIYFALKGENFDGNLFAQDALQAGALAVVVDNAELATQKQIIYVENVLETLQQLANYHRKQFQIPVIGITGSNGKTTTKELLQAVLSQKYHVIATKGNFNNHIGVPLTLLQMNASHEIAIIEMGANHVHEIGFLCGICEPTFAVITSIGIAHIGLFGSFEAIKETKAELYKWVAQHQGKAFVNQDLPILVEMADRMQVKEQIEYGSHLKGGGYEFHFESADPFVKFRMGEQWVETQLPGTYNYANFITAATVGKYFKVPDSEIKSALEGYSSTNNRSQIVNKGSLTLILDAYNANPSSMESALNNFKEMKSPQKGAILGGMRELGAYSAQEHQRIAEMAEALELDFLVLVGDEFQEVKSAPHTLKFSNVEQVKLWWQKQELFDFLVLIKGSRHYCLEKILD